MTLICFYFFVLEFLQYKSVDKMADGLMPAVRLLLASFTDRAEDIQEDIRNMLKNINRLNTNWLTISF